MHVATMSDSELEAIEGGIAPLIVLAAAVLTIGGCSASCTRTSADGSSTKVEVQLGGNSKN
jgi:lactobin A/cerein 7B family class IIb bacteriocin